MIWDLSTRATESNQRSVESFYYLTAPKSVNSGVIYASYSRSENKVVVNTQDYQNAYYKCSDNKTEVSAGDGVKWTNDTLPTNVDFSILLNEKMVDFSKPVTFVVDGKQLKAMVVPNQATLKETTEERGDQNYQFVAKVSYSKLKSLL